MSVITTFIFIVGLAACLPALSVGVRCFECNAFVHGSTHTCTNPEIHTGCFSCLRAFTKVRLHDRGGVERFSTVVQRFCIRVGPYVIRTQGCVIHKNNGGYTERCYCYYDLCNSSLTLRPQWTSLCVVLTTVAFLSAMFR